MLDELVPRAKTDHAGRSAIIQASNALFVLPVRYQQIIQMGEVSTNYQLLPGDRIYVPSLTRWQDIKQTLRPAGDR